MSAIQGKTGLCWQPEQLSSEGGGAIGLGRHTGTAPLHSKGTHETVVLKGE